MARLADYGEERLLNFFLNTAAPQPTQPTSLRLALHTADPTETGTVAEVPTATWTNYVRATVNNDGSTTPFMTAASANAGKHESQNSGEISFGTATATGQVTVTHTSLWDQSNTNCWVVGPLNSAQPVVDGNPVRFPSGTLLITFD